MKNLMLMDLVIFLKLLKMDFGVNITKWKMTILSTEDILCGRIEVIKKPILDDVEKEYLSGVIKPFRDKVVDVINWKKYHVQRYENRKKI